MAETKKTASVKPAAKPAAAKAADTKTAQATTAPETSAAKAETAEVKKEEPKAAKKTPGRKPAAKKAATAKTTTKKTTAAAKKAEEATVKETIHVQFADKSYTSEDLVRIAKDVWKYDLNQKDEDFKTVELYVKPEESVVYYVINGEVKGSFGI